MYCTAFYKLVAVVFCLLPYTEGRDCLAFQCGDLCIDMSRVNDGYDDCGDGSDEVKRITSPCNDRMCCPCDGYVFNSRCINGTCQCLPGYYSNELRTICVKRAISDTCESDDDCDIPNGGCYNGTCSCDVKFRGEAGEIVCSKRLLGDGVCITGDDCHVEDAVCSNGTCACPYGHRVAFGRAECLPLTIHEYCDIDDVTDGCRAAVPHSSCVNGRCACDDGYVPTVDLSSCSRRKIEDNTCVASRDCSAAVENSECLLGTCRCVSGYYASTDKTQCIQRYVGDACTSSIDCSAVIQHSVCSARLICDCSSGFHVIDASKKCVKHLKLGETCHQDIECSHSVADSACLNQTCQCVDGYTEEGTTNTCRLRKIGDRCYTATDCEKAINDSDCVHGQCACVPSHVQVELANGTVICTHRLCSSDVDCQEALPFSYCVDRAWCKCMVGFYRSEDGSNCTRLQLGDECSYDEECSRFIGGSVCNESACSCARGFMRDKNACARRRLLDSCNVDDDCTIGHSVCSMPNRICECDVGFYSNGSDCSRINLFDRCNTTIDCIHAENAVCRNMSCECQNGHLPVSNSTGCRNRIIGDICVWDDDCEVSVENSQCVNDTCVCLSGFTDNLGGTYCLRRRITDSCDMTSDCQDAVRNSECRNGTCVCQVGFSPHDDNKMCEMRYIGDVCSTHQDCVNVENSVCNATECVCLPGYASNDSSTYCKRREIFDRCHSDVDCNSVIENSECLHMQCSCISGFVDSNSSVCVRRKIFDSCILDADCRDSVNFSMCVDAMCVCLGGYYANDTDLTTCVKRKIGDPTCTVAGDCADSIDNSLCKDGVCECRAGYSAQSNGSECVLRQIGRESCVNDRDCNAAVNNSNCTSGKCFCNSGYHVESNKASCTKRRVGDQTCRVHTDCADAVPNSFCYSSQCSCAVGHEVFANKTRCIKKPTRIGDRCFYPTQCAINVDHLSECTEDGVCQCQKQYFRFSRGTRCMPYPQKLGEACDTDERCAAVVRYSECRHLCMCRPFFYADSENTKCRAFTSFVGGRCLNNFDCSRVSHSECTRDCNGGICQTRRKCSCYYGYLPNAKRTGCYERDHLPEYIAQGSVLAERKRCNVDEPNACNISRVWCQAHGIHRGTCRCRPTYAADSPVVNDTTCKDSLSYQLTLTLAEVAHTYDYLKIMEIPGENNVQNNITQHFYSRIANDGIHIVMKNISNNFGYISCDVIHLNLSRDGVKVTAALYFRYLIDPRKIDIGDIIAQMKENIERNGNELGSSRMKVASTKGLSIEDIDECSYYGMTDCSYGAWCQNNNGSFYCTCKLSYDDISADPRFRPGRVCIGVSPQNRGLKSACSDGDCNTKWEYVAIAAVLVAAILVLMTLFEVFWHKDKSKSDREFYERVNRNMETQASLVTDASEDIYEADFGREDSISSFGARSERCRQQTSRRLQQSDGRRGRARGRGSFRSPESYSSALSDLGQESAKRLGSGGSETSTGRDAGGLTNKGSYDE